MAPRLSSRPIFESSHQRARRRASSGARYVMAVALVLVIAVLVVLGVVAVVGLVLT